jgi:hypothetical protein
MRKVLTKNKLVELLYLLMRDAAPTGEIVRIIRMMTGHLDDDQTSYTSKELQSYAIRLAEELLETPEIE